AISAVTVDCEVIIEAGNPHYSEPLHNREARAINNREILIREDFANGPSRFQICRDDLLKPYGTAADTVPKAFSCMPVITAVQEKPCLDNDVIARNMVARGSQKGFSARVIYVPD